MPRSAPWIRRDRAESGRVVRDLASEKEAEAFKRRVEEGWSELEEVTVEMALQEYQQQLADKGTKPGTTTRSARGR
jgi:hypothetical protein